GRRSPTRWSTRRSSIASDPALSSSRRKPGSTCQHLVGGTVDPGFRRDDLEWDERRPRLDRSLLLCHDRAALGRASRGHTWRLIWHFSGWSSSASGWLADR